MHRLPLRVVVLGVVLLTPIVPVAHATAPTCPTMAPVLGDTPAQKGDKLRKTILCNVQPIRDEFSSARTASHTANGLNALFSALGGIATGVTKPSPAKSIGVGTAAVGSFIAFWAFNKSQDAQLVTCMTNVDRAVTAWDISSQLDADYKAFRKAIDDEVKNCPELGDLNTAIRMF